MELKNLLSLSTVFLLASCVNETEHLADVGPNEPSSAPLVLHYNEAVKNFSVFVKFKNEFINGVEENSSKPLSRTLSSRSGINRFDKFLSESNAISFKRVFPKNKFEKRLVESGLNLWYEVKFDSSVSSQELKTTLSSISELSVVQFDAAVCLIDTNSETVNASANIASSSENIVDDPYLSLQWHYYNDGTLFDMCKAGADINLLNAWKTTMGDNSVIVSVIDEGVMYNHPDLSPNMWVNEAELNGTEGVDDDGNGYVDDIYGYDFVYNTGNISYGAHGTHVAGTVSAVNNNGIGVSGVAGGSGNGDGARLMSCPILVEGEDGAVSDIAKAVVYAADNGAVISQNSWGYTLPNIDWENSSMFSLERDAYKYFIDYAGLDENGDVVGPMKGGIVIFAAGNYGHQYGSAKFWPSAHPDFLSVSSIGCDYNPAYYTCYGSWSDVIAPGGDMVFASNSEGSGGILSTSVDKNAPTYAYLQGTSMACPHVSGIAALAISAARKANYQITSSQLKDILTQSTRPIDNFFGGRKSDNGRYTGVAFDLDMAAYKGLMGTGLIDAALVVDNVAKLAGTPSDHTAPSALEEVKLLESDYTSLTLSWANLSDYQGNPLEQYMVYYDLSPFTVDDEGFLENKNLNTPVLVSAENVGIGSQISVQLSGLSHGSEYNVAIVGVDKWRNYSKPYIGKFSTAQLVPGNPVSGLKATEITTSSIAIEWLEGADCLGNPYISYHIIYSDNAEYENAKTVIYRPSAVLNNKCTKNLTGLLPGVEYFIKVVGYDSSNLASQPAELRCRTVSNTAPEITPNFELPVELQYWEPRDLTFGVNDKEGDDWTASIDDNSVWSLTVEENSILLHFNAPVSIQGQQELVIRVTDSKGSENEYRLVYNVISNVAPVLKEQIGDFYIEALNSAQTISLDQFFSDDNNEVLNFSCSVNGESVKAEISDKTLSLVGVKNGLSNVTVKGTDAGNKFAECQFSVMVRQSDADVDLYPNPVKDYLNIRMGKNVNGSVSVRLINAFGSIVQESEVVVAPFAPGKLDMSNMASGYYIVEVEYNGETYKGNVVKL